MPKRISTARGREFGAGLRAAITGASLTSRAVAEFLDWDEAKLSDVVYLDSLHGGTWLEATPERRPYTETFERLVTVAAPPRTPSADWSRPHSC